MRQRFDAYRFDLDLDEPRLLAETGYLAQARAEAEALALAAPHDPARLGLRGQLEHRMGSISAAIETFRRLHDGSPHNHEALLRLAVMREEEARERPSGADQPWVRRALRLLGQRQQGAALAACAEGQALARSVRDLEQQKLLAVLAAHVLEQAGRRSEAAGVLERLGSEPAFAHDPDRLAVLARIYEQAGEHGKAERVLAFLASGAKLSAFPRLVAARRALGDEPGALEAQQDFERAFRQRMQRLEPEGRLEAAVDRYVSARRLGRLDLPEVAGLEPGPERGIARLVGGDPASALPDLGQAATGWRAAALLAGGRSDEALASAEAAVLERSEPDEPLAHLLADCLEADPSRRMDGRAIELAREAMRRALESAPASPRSLRRLAILEEHGGDQALAERLRTRALAANDHPWPPPGVVRAAAIYALPGKAKGIVHDVIARRRPATGDRRGRLDDESIHGELGPGVLDQLRRTFASVRETLAARFPERVSSFDDWSYGVHLTKEDEPSGGPSLGLPVAMAFASVLLDVRIPPYYVFTGALSYDGAGQLAVRQVGEVGLKLKGTLHAGARFLVLPLGQEEEAAASGDVPPRIAAGAIRGVGTLDEALALVLERPVVAAI
ncbi:hypothetical protein [Vulgatibacter incomptus]|uniref:TPR domain protein, putative component of TonB system n=1 Tax=Vulgatibacter incomptus TaxID=1391653 RepID=A0A0K1PIB4_9BACT|nr:hypothetical protein [Vulgatibacter incomptus]AKU93278.1 TPR domain protein, putative component of TonB system [Vulgatibacter incomptus]